MRWPGQMERASRDIVYTFKHNQEVETTSVKGLKEVTHICIQNKQNQTENISFKIPVIKS